VTHLSPALILFTVLAANSPAITIDVTNRSFATIGTGHDLAVHFGVWNYGINNPGFEPFPTTIGFQIIGPLEADVGLGAGQSSTAGSPVDFGFNAYLEALDGTVSIQSPDALIPSLGSLSIQGGSPTQFQILSGSFTLSLFQSQAVFGSNLANFNNAAVIRLHNLGDPFTIGLGSPYSVRDAISEPGISGPGPARTAGIPGEVTLSIPEPATWMLLAGAIVLFGFVRLGGVRKIG